MAPSDPNHILPPAAHSAAAPAAPAAGVPLGRAAGFVSAGAASETKARAVRRRYALQRIAQQVLPDHRVAGCLRAMTGGLVEVLHHPEHGGASFGGLITCGNGWVCPVCSAKILSRRADELAEGARRWQDRGGRLLLLTLTLRHERGVGLDEYLKALNEAYRLLRQGRAWQDFKRRYGLKGSVTRREVTHGRAGWHPHLHGLLFLEGTTARDDLDELSNWLKKRWVAVLSRLGYTASEENGCDLRRAGDGAAEYIGKMTAQWSVAKEVADSGTKNALRGNETIAQILLRAGEGDAEAIYLYREYAKATYGKAVLVWSAGLRKLLDIEEKEETDEEVAAKQTSAAVGLVALTPLQWAHVLAGELRGELLATAVAGDTGQVVLWLAKQGIYLDDWQIGYDRRARAAHFGPETVL